MAAGWLKMLRCVDCANSVGHRQDIYQRNGAIVWKIRNGSRRLRLELYGR